MAVESDLIYDVGLHNGTDTAYYLQKGFRVVAIDANPMLVSSAEARFSKQIASGQLKVLNIGIGEREETLSFWVNEANDTQSSFDKARAMRYGPCREIVVHCQPLSAVMEAFGVPYYLKTDIEGNDYLCVRALVPGKLPRYISVELDSDHDLVTELHDLGYENFKVINQASFTDSTPIFRGQIGLRALRKLSSRAPRVRQIIKRSGLSRHLRKIYFDNFVDRFEHEFEEGSSGPFGEETWGPWYSFSEIRGRIKELQRKLVHGHVPPGTFWLDIHATRAAA